jgi:hypothetical protein
MHLQSCLERFEKFVGFEAEHALVVRQLIADNFIVCPDPDSDNLSYVFCDDDGITPDGLIGVVAGEPTAIVAKAEDYPW